MYATQQRILVDFSLTGGSQADEAAIDELVAQLDMKQPHIVSFKKALAPAPVAVAAAALESEEVGASAPAAAKVEKEGGEQVRAHGCTRPFR